MARYAVHKGIFAQAQVALWDAALHFVKVCGKPRPVPLRGEALQDMEVVAHIVPRLLYLPDSRPEAVIPRLLHGQEQILLPEAVIAVQAGRHKVKERIEQQEQ